MSRGEEESGIGRDISYQYDQEQHMITHDKAANAKRRR